ncbi:MAG: TVP38/TMEM64 family protein [Bacilli bacterium]|nr:TVP38/TMEM64 family protein [Bacilli bacterium]
MDIVNTIIDYSTNFMSIGGVPFGFFLVFIESFIPILPLSVFVALNVNAFGFFIGILISWLATALGSVFCYLLFTLIEDKITDKFFGKKTVKRIQKSISKFDKISFSSLVLLVTLPFTPSCLVNILSGLTKMKKEKFITAIFIGKIFSVTFWGYIGKSIIESITDLKSMLFIIVTLIIAYIISKIINKKFEIE